MPEVITPEPRTGRLANRLAFERVRRSLLWRRNLRNGDTQWRRSWELVEGHHWKDGSTKKETSPDQPNHRITVNKTGAAVEDYLPFLIGRDPVFRLRATQGPEHVPNVRAQEALLNYFWRERKMLRPLKRAGLDLIVTGTGILKTGYAFEIDESAQEDRDGTLNYDEAVRRDEPYLKWIPPVMFVPDWEAPEQDLETSRWAAQVIVKPLGEVIANERYSAKIRREIRMGRVSPTSLPRWMDREQMPTNPAIAEALGLPKIPEPVMQSQTPVVMYEVWDQRYGIYRLLLDTENDPEPLVETAWPYEYLDGFPFALAKFKEVNGQWYGHGLPLGLADQQDELNRNRTYRFLTRRKHAAQKIGVNAEMTGIDVDKLDDPNDPTYIAVQGANESSFFKIPSPDIPQDSDKVEADIDRDMQEIMGRDALLSGGRLPSRTSAAEIRARQGFIGAKIEGKVHNLDEMVREVGRQLLQHIRDNFSRPRAVRLLGAKGDAFVTVTSEAIRSEADIELETTSKQQFDPAMEREQAMRLLEVSMAGAEVLQGQIDFPELYKFVFEKMGERDVDRFFLPARSDATAPDDPNPTGGPQLERAPGPENPETAQLQSEGALGALSPEAVALGG